LRGSDGGGGGGGSATADTAASREWSRCPAKRCLLTYCVRPPSTTVQSALAMITSQNAPCQNGLKNRNVRRILVRGVNASLPPDAKKFMKI